MISTSRMLMAINIRLNIISHFNWLSDRLNLEFFIAFTSCLPETKLALVLSGFAKDGSINLCLLFTKQLPALNSSAGNQLFYKIFNFIITIEGFVIIILAYRRK
jgi:hypothetical protein